jgi:glutamine cyclotransferase
MYGRSDVRVSHVDTGRVEARTPLDAQWFGEGLARRGDRLYQITWQKPDGFVYSVHDLSRVGTFKTPLTDGWGIATDGDGLFVISDGSSALTWVDPDAGFKAVRKVEVKDGDRPVHWLNEVRFCGARPVAVLLLLSWLLRVEQRQPGLGAVIGIQAARRMAMLARTLGGLCARPGSTIAEPASTPVPWSTRPASPPPHATVQPYATLPTLHATRPQPKPQLEVIRGEVWANIWQTECIARICPQTGKVTGWVLMHGLRDGLVARNLPNGGTILEVLNGGRLWGACGPSRRRGIECRSRVVFKTPGEAFQHPLERREQPLAALLLPVWCDALRGIGF